jgi:alkylation response protein AidB-like acyl-CoA dehydrogenase
MTLQFAFTQEQQLIRETARRFFDEHATSQHMRAALETPEGYDAQLWHQMASDLGWAGLTIPERYGGAGLGMVELAILQHEQGRRLVPSPFFSTVCLAAPLIQQCATESQKTRWLGRIASGDLRVAVALTGRRGRPGAAGITAELVAEGGGGFRLSGESNFVIHGHACDSLLVAARSLGSWSADGITAGGFRADGLSLVMVEPARAGVTIEKLVTLDLTRPMARVTFDAIRISAEEVLGPEGAASLGFERALDLARVAIAAEAVGAAERILEMTVQYAKDRLQFGRAIGSFQAVKHRLADMMVAVEAARSASWYAACVADERDSELAEAASISKSACCDALFNCAANAIQLHGGIGFTWDHDAHLYFKRARAASTLLGTPSWHRERLAQILNVGGPALVPAA